jgi:hypothetical protein
VGYAQRNFFAPIPKVANFAVLNADLYQACLNDTQRRVRGETRLVAEVWQAEKATLLPINPVDYPACTSHAVKVNPYSQVVFETNRYSVPTEYTGRQLALRAFPFRVEILSLAQIVAEHARCFGREQDILNPLHYLGLLEQRPGAFEHAIPIRQWRQNWRHPRIHHHSQAASQLPGRSGEPRGAASAGIGRRSPGWRSALHTPIGFTPGITSSA